MISRMDMTRRAFLATASASLLQSAEPIIDIHQHTNYVGRTDEALVAHQRAMGITTYQKICHRLPPSIYAASSRLSGTPSMNCRSRKVPKAENAAGMMSPE